MPLVTTPSLRRLPWKTLCIAIAACSGVAQAQDVQLPGLQLAQLETVTIIGDPTDPQSTTGSAFVVDQEALQKFEYTNVHSILRSVPGVYVREEDGLGTFPRIGIRASVSGRSDRISLLEDGIPAAMAPYADTAAYYFPNVGRMSAIEVLKGPELLKYGPQTTSGALNLVSTPIPETVGGQLKAEVGDHGSRKIHANYGANTEQLGWLLETYQSETDGFQNIDRSNINPGRDVEEYMAKLRWRSAADATYAQQLDVKVLKGDEVANVSYLGLTDEDFKANSNRRYGLSELEQMQRGRESASIQYQIAFSDNHALTATAYRNDTYRDYTRLHTINGIGLAAGAGGITGQINNGAAGSDLLQDILDGTADTTHNNGVRYNHNLRNYVSVGFQLEWLSRFELGNTQHELNVGVRHHEDERNNLDGSRTFYDQRNGSLVFNRYDAGSWITSDAEALAIWVSDTITVGNWTIVPLVRFEDIETTVDVNDPNSAGNSLDKTTFGLGVNYALNDQWTLLAGIHEGFAPPGATATDGQRGEESTNFEGGIRYRGDALALDAIAFYSDYSNALRNCLVANPCSGGVIDGTEQTGSKEVQGLELRLATELYSSDALSVPLALTYTYTSGEYTKDSDTGNVLKGDDLEYIPENIVSLQIGLEGFQGWRLDAVLNYGDGSCINSTCSRDSVDDTFLSTQSLTTVDLAGSYPLTRAVNVYAKVDNLFDEQRITHRGADGARGNIGRNVAVGMRVTF